MEIETLQIKRITGNWGTHKTKIFEQGEPILVSAGVIPNINYPVFLFGEKDNTLESIYNNGNIFVNKNSINALISDNNKTIAPTTTPLPIGDSNSIGNAETFAKADHIHTLDKEVAEKALGVNENTTTEFNCRRIKAGTLNPLDDNDAKTIGGSVGDIYIRYDI